MNAKQEYTAKRFDLIPSNLTVCNACFFDGYLYVGMSFKSMLGKPEGVLMVDIEGQYIEEPVSHTYDFEDRGFAIITDIERHPYKRKFEEIGPVYSIKKWNNMLVVGGKKGLLIWPKDEKHKIISLDDGINAASAVDDDTLLIGGNSFLGFYRHSTGEIERYPFGVEDIMYLKEIHAVSVLPECFAIGRDISPSQEFLPAIGFLRKDIHAKRTEVEEFFRTHSGLPNDKMSELIEFPKYETQKNKFSSIASLIEACIKKEPTYVYDLSFWKGWLVVVEFNRTYAIRASDGEIVEFSHGGFLIEQNLQCTDEFWIGGTWGHGVMIIRYDDKTQAWIEDKEISAVINSEMAKAAKVSEPSKEIGPVVDIAAIAYAEMVKSLELSERFEPSITCIHFFPDKVLVGTETGGTYLIEKVSDNSVNFSKRTGP